MRRATLHVSMVKTSTNTLTQLELAVLERFALEKSANDIARELKLSLQDVNEMRLAIMQKTNTRSMVGLVKVAIQAGLVQGYHYR